MTYYIYLYLRMHTHSRLTKQVFMKLTFFLILKNEPIQKMIILFSKSTK